MLVAKLKTETVNFLVWSYRMEEPKHLRDAWKQKHEVLLLMNAICDKDLSRTSRTSRTSMLKNNEWRVRVVRKQSVTYDVDKNRKKYYVREKTGTYCISTDGSTTRGLQVLVQKFNSRSYTVATCTYWGITELPTSRAPLAAVDCLCGGTVYCLLSLGVTVCTKRPKKTGILHWQLRIFPSHPSSPLLRNLLVKLKLKWELWKSERSSISSSNECIKAADKNNICHLSHESAESIDCSIGSGYVFREKFSFFLDEASEVARNQDGIEEHGAHRHDELQWAEFRGNLWPWNRYDEAEARGKFTRKNVFLGENLRDNPRLFNSS